MPQFDTVAFFSQLFWVFLAFLTLYIILSFYILPSIAISLKARKKLSSLEKMDSDYTVISKSLFNLKCEPILLQSINSCKSVFGKSSLSQANESQVFPTCDSKMLNSSCVANIRVRKLMSSFLWLQLSSLGSK